MPQQEIYNEIKKVLVKSNSNHILIHSDILFGFKLPFENHDQFLESHFVYLESLCKDLEIWMPTFNYDFLKSQSYNVKHNPSQVGNLSEYFRKYKSNWRTAIPVFSFSGTGEKPILPYRSEIDPFDQKSLFAELQAKDALFMHYGSKFHSTTLIHYVERISGKLLYRYDKVFRGEVIEDNNKNLVALKYHVRPLGYYLDYDWVRLEQELINERILLKYREGRTNISICRVRELVDFWLEKINKNPLYLLNKETTNWVKLKLKNSFVPFLITDFE